MTKKTIAIMGQPRSQKKVKHHVDGVGAVTQSDVADGESECRNMGKEGDAVEVKTPDVAQREAAMAEALIIITRTT